MDPFDDHPQRYALVNELHARPFPRIPVPGRALYLAFKEPHDAANRDRAKDHAHLVDLLTRSAAGLPEPGITHYAGEIGRHALKWESHTEFTTYLAFAPGCASRPFDPAETEVFPRSWTTAAPGGRLAAVQIRIETLPDDPALIEPLLDDWFVHESLVCTWVLEEAVVIAGDFRIDPNGQMRFALFVRPGTGEDRVGRVVQRICELETYRAMSMLGLSRARSLSERLNALDPKLSELVEGMGDDARSAEQTLHQLLSISADLESLAVQFSFRFSATGAYEAIVRDRVESLRETRFGGRQMLGEFMARRYDPAVRTVKSAETRLQQMAARAARAGELLRTRVDVERSAHNQQVLESMDRRADLQLRLQHTVEGLSVVAISYYAVSLAGYLAYPVARHFGFSKELMIAGLTPVVIGLVWLMVRRIRKGVGGH
ncbi:hypothetical protein DL1_16210 [Thioclava dalianensis]|uniref:Egg lysin n=1 Tax=Thioclava dalianensis TaxID=1185766 RepID=A0A074TNR5_9RHOB|nr:DUF3422 domain-containing protein [Thioclava dalianensis]KEP70643.1 hypothetical protein DL1_16210 [Thioclava dalianensis]SFN05869.1 Uncharacterized membrane-anchored protein [Thioclava dalianensis]